MKAAMAIEDKRDKNSRLFQGGLIYKGAVLCNAENANEKSQMIRFIVATVESDNPE